MDSITAENEKTVTSNGIVLKSIAHFFSYLLHPVFVPLYVIFFLIYIHPFAFVGFSPDEKIKTIFIVALNLVFFPLLSVLLLKALGFIESIYLRTQKDRIIPYIASGIFFFWAYTVFKEQHRYPSILTIYVFGIFLASSAALITNIYLKVSMHAIGMGGWLALFLLMSYNDGMMMSWPLALVILLTGIVCTARMLINAHQPKEIYIGLLIGILSQFVAAYIIL